MNKLNGFLYGLLSSASFGLIPMFTIPAMQQGMQFESILLYRFAFATLALGVILLIDGQSFRINRRDIPSLLLLAFFYLISAVFLFWGYKFMASGIATTLHFMYPVLTTLIMMLFFREKKSIWRFMAIALAVAGVFFLSQGDVRKYYIYRYLYRSPLCFGICALFSHCEPAKSRSDEGATAHILCLPFRNPAPFHRNWYNRTYPTDPQPTYSRKSGNACHYPNRYF